MSRSLSGVENGRVRRRRMGRLTSPVNLVWRRNRPWPSLVDFSVLMVLFVPLPSLCGVAWLVQTRTEPPAMSRVIPLIHEE